MISISATSLLSLALIAAMPSVPPSTLAVDSACTVELLRVNRVLLEDSTIPALDASSVSLDGTRLLVVGRPAIGVVLRGDAVPSAAESNAVGIIGRPGEGWKWVPPPKDQGFSSPRATRIGDDRWAVTMLVGKRSPFDPQLYERAELWYGVFARGRWTGFKRIGEFEGAYLGYDRASNLVRAGGQVGLAFAFDRSAERQSNARGNQGVVLVRVVGEEVRIDTLHTWAAPTYVRLSDMEQSGWRVITTEPHFDLGRSWPSALYVTEFRNGWRLRRRLVADSARSVTAPVVTRAGENLAIGWRVVGSDDAQSAELQHALLSEDGRFSIAGRTRVGTTAVGALLLATATGASAWIIPDRTVQAFRAVVSESAGQSPAKESLLSIPIDNFRPLLVKSTDSSAWVVNGIVTQREGVHFGQTIVSSIALRCSPR